MPTNGVSGQPQKSPPARARLPRLAWIHQSLLIVMLLSLSVPFAWGQTSSELEAYRLSEQMIRLREQGKYEEAARVGERAVSIGEQAFGPDHPDFASDLHNLALVYKDLGNYVRALSLAQQAVGIMEKARGPDHPDTAHALTNLANVYDSLGDYSRALSLHQRALAIREKNFGSEHMDTAGSLTNLANVYDSLGNYAQAISLFQQALAIQEKVLGPNHPDLGDTLTNLAVTYSNLGDFDRVASLEQRALTIAQKNWGPEHPETLTLLHNIAATYDRAGKYDKALPLYEQVLAAKERALGSDHPELAPTLQNLAGIYQKTKDRNKARSLYERALAIIEKTLGPDHPDAVSIRNDLSRFQTPRNTVEGPSPELLSLQKDLALSEKKLGPDHPQTAAILVTLASTYAKLGNYAQARLLYRRALTTQEQALGPEHHALTDTLHGMAKVHEAMRNYDKALSFHKRALAINEKSLGPDHYYTALSLTRLAYSYALIGDLAQSRPLFQRARTIMENTVGSDAPAVAAPLLGLSIVGPPDQKEELAEQATRLLEPYLPNQPYIFQDFESALTLVAQIEAKVEQWSIQKLKYFLEKGKLRKNSLELPSEIKNDLAELASTIEKLRAAMQKNLPIQHPQYRATAELMSRVAHLYILAQQYEKALHTFQWSLPAEDHYFANVFSASSEQQKRQFTERARWNYIFALSLISEKFSSDPNVVRWGLELVLRRKGIILDAQTLVQEEQYGTRSENVLQARQRLQKLRSDLSHLVLTRSSQEKEEIYSHTYKDLEDSIAREEEFLALHSRVVAQELVRRDLTAEMVAKRLPKRSALVEFVRVWPLAMAGGSDVQMAAYASSPLGKVLPSYLAFVLTSDNQITLVNLGRAHAIDTAISETLTALNDSTFRTDLAAHTETTNAKLAELYDLLILPLEHVLDTSSSLIVSPDGELNKVPFAALRTPNGRYLVEQSTVSHISSGRDLLLKKGTGDDTAGLLLVANPAFDQHDALGTEASIPSTARTRARGRQFEPLLGTADEAQRISHLLTGHKQILQGKAATESAFRAMKSPNVLHLASHSFFVEDTVLPPEEDAFTPYTTEELHDYISGALDELDKDRLPLDISNLSKAKAPTIVSSLARSGLALAGANWASDLPPTDDGLLTALEISSLNLHGTDLVVLSGCDTGRGDVQVGEGVYGLRRAFMLAGANNLVMSLWAVNDTFVVDHMEEFYRHYSNGMTPAAALREAQLWSINFLREETQKELGQPLAPVRLWAPFIAQQTGASFHTTPGKGFSPTYPTYHWWHLIVFVLASTGLVILSRIRLQTVPTDPTVTRSPVTGEPLCLVPTGALNGLPPSILLEQDRLLVGSDPGCDIVLPHASIAPQHARLERRAQGLVVFDLDSPQGTYVNGRRVQERLIKAGWRLRLGQVEFTVQNTPST